MKFCKNILSFIMAGTLALSAVPLAELRAFAADKDDEKTFDGRYRLDDRVNESGWRFKTYSEDPDTYEKLVKYMFGSDLSKVTYRDLQDESYLDLGGAGLTELPMDILKYMTGLTSIDLSDNYLTNDDVRDFNARRLTRLRTIDLSGNFLTSVPSWVVSSDASTKRLEENFIKGYEPRTIETLSSAYYFSDGDSINLRDFEREITDSVRFDDGSEIPEVWLDEFEGDILTADLEEFKKLAGLNEKNDKTIVYTSPDSTVVDIPVRLGEFAETAVQVYLMNGTDLSSVKMLLAALINETLNASAYTDNSKKNYENAKKVAQAVYNSGTNDFDIYKNAFDRLNSARRDLEEVADTNIMGAVKAYIDDSKNYPEADYTVKSYAEFKTALDGLNNLQKDSKNATAEQAETAIKRFQNALAGLVPTSLKVPEKAPKTDFEGIYGLNTTKSYEGATQNGLKYKWLFSGKNITAPAEFNPEIKDTDAAEPDILLDSGSAGSYLLFSTVQTGAFPGKGTLTISPVPDGFADGKYYLYKWDGSGKKGVLESEVNVKNKSVSVSLSEGGLYYIGKTLNNLDFSSEEFQADDEAKRIVTPLSLGYTVSNFKNKLIYGKYAEIRDKNGALVSNSSRVITGMTVKVPGKDAYTIYVMGDIDQNGRVNIGDASMLAILSSQDAITPEILLYGDADGNGRININDATKIAQIVANDG